MSKFYLRLILRKLYPHTLFWFLKGSVPPYPPSMKRRFLSNLGISGALWIETGTYLGETTKYLSRKKYDVITIEPSPSLYKFNERRFKKHPNVRVIYGTSQDKLASAISLTDANYNFWLDGHYSGGLTHNGGDAPILIELEQIYRHVMPNRNFMIFVDDFRLTKQGTQGDSTYPARDELMGWILSKGLMWNVEKDILQIWRTES